MTEDVVLNWICCQCGATVPERSTPHANASTGLTCPHPDRYCAACTARKALHRKRAADCNPTIACNYNITYPLSSSKKRGVHRDVLCWNVSCSFLLGGSDFPIPVSNFSPVRNDLPYYRLASDLAS